MRVGQQYSICDVERGGSDGGVQCLGNIVAAPDSINFSGNWVSAGISQSGGKL